MSEHHMFLHFFYGWQELVSYIVLLSVATVILYFLLRNW